MIDAPFIPEALRLSVAVASCAILVLACDAPCEDGYRRVGSQCRRIDASVSEANDGTDDDDAETQTADGSIDPPPTCGDGVTSGSEACDDGNRADADGCSSQCSPESAFGCTGKPSDCRRIPQPPSLTGESSIAHSHPTFVWSIPERTTNFALESGESWTFVSSSQTSFTYEDAPQGEVVFRVRACSGEALAYCSRPASFTTKVILLGQSYPPAWKGTKRSLSQTAFGHTTPVACDNCYQDQNGTPLGLDAIQAKIASALTRGADLIELDIVAVGDALYVSGIDSPDVGSLARLSDVVGFPALLVSDALLALEIREGGMDPSAFASLLLRELSQLGELWTVGRPLVVRASDAKVAYLSAVRSSAFPFQIHNLRTWILYSTPPSLASSTYETLAQSYTGIEIPHGTGSLFSVLKRAHDAGLGVSVGPVPGPRSYGQAALLGLRERADMFSTVYRVDQARALITAANGAGLLDATDLSSTATAATAWISRGTLNGAPASRTSTLGTPFAGTVLSAPRVESRMGVGSYFDFTAPNLSLTLWDTSIAPAAGEGLFLSTNVVLPADFFSASDGSPTSVLGACTETSSGMCLRLRNAGPGTTRAVEVSAASGSKVQLTSYPQVGRNDARCPESARFIDALDGSQSYWISVLRPENGPAVLLINGRCASVSSDTGAVTGGTGKTSLGPGAARSGGSIQFGEVQLLPNTSQHDLN